MEVKLTKSEPKSEVFPKGNHSAIFISKVSGGKFKYFFSRSTGEFYGKTFHDKEVGLEIKIPYEMASIHFELVGDSDVIFEYSLC